jgi:hypothetical protein
MSIAGVVIPSTFAFLQRSSAGRRMANLRQNITIKSCSILKTIGDQFSKLSFVAKDSRRRCFICLASFSQVHRARHFDGRVSNDTGECGRNSNAFDRRDVIVEDQRSANNDDDSLDMTRDCISERRCISYDQKRRKRH